MRLILTGFAALVLVSACAPAPYPVAVGPALRPIVAAAPPLIYADPGRDCREQLAQARSATRQAEAEAVEARRAYAYGAPRRVVRREADQAAWAAARARGERRDAAYAC